MSVCRDCRSAAVVAARAALCVLADDNADDTERQVAGDVAVEAIEVLCVPIGEAGTW